MLNGPTKLLPRLLLFNMKIYLAPIIVLSQKAANGAERHDKRVTVEIAKLAQQADPTLHAGVITYLHKIQRLETPRRTVISSIGTINMANGFLGQALRT